MHPLFPVLSNVAYIWLVIVVWITHSCCDFNYSTIWTYHLCGLKSKASNSWYWKKCLSAKLFYQLLMHTIFEKLSFSIKTINLLKGKYNLDQELRPHLATAVTLNSRKTVFSALIICLHPDSLVQGICWCISNRQETLPDIHTVSLVHITKLWEFITITESSVQSSNDQLGVRTPGYFNQSF